MNHEAHIDRNSFDTLTGRWTNQRVVIRDGVRRDLTFTIRIYNPTELTQLCVQAGLQPVRWASKWEGEPLSTEGRRMILITQKSVV